MVGPLRAPGAWPRVPHRAPASHGLIIPCCRWVWRTAVGGQQSLLLLAAYSRPPHPTAPGTLPNPLPSPPHTHTTPPPPQDGTLPRWAEDLPAVPPGHVEALWRVQLAEGLKGEGNAAFAAGEWRAAARKYTQGVRWVPEWGGGEGGVGMGPLVALAVGGVCVATGGVRVCMECASTHVYTYNVT